MHKDTEQGLNNAITVNPTTFVTNILQSTKLYHLLGTFNKFSTPGNIICYW